MKTKVQVVALLVAASFSAFAVDALAIGNLADIQIFDRAENRQLPLYWHEGKAYVAGKPGNEYQVSVRNRAGTDVLTVVSVDGVNVVSGETAAPEQTGYVLGNGVQYDIRGWRKSQSRTAAFYFTQLPDSYAARTGRPDNVGVIGVAVFRRKAVVPPVAISRLREAPEARSSAAESARDDAGNLARQAPRAASGASSDSPAPAAPQMQLEKSLGTGHGRSETSVVRNVSFERATPYPEDVITIYYDSYNNLLARGIVPPAPVARPLPQPQPFPGRFVPDPPRS